MTDTNTSSPIFCVNNCGFYGNTLTNNFCSTCYKIEQQKNGNDVLVPLPTDEEKPEPELQTSPVQHTNAKELITEPETQELFETTKTGVELKQISLAGPTKTIKKQTRTSVVRCAQCSRRVGIYGFLCRCGTTFCGVHRHSDKHNCTFDYAQENKKYLTAANPRVDAPKLVDRA